MRFRKEVRAEVICGVRESAEVSFVQSILATAERVDIVQLSGLLMDWVQSRVDVRLSLDEHLLGGIRADG